MMGFPPTISYYVKKSLYDTMMGFPPTISDYVKKSLYSTIITAAVKSNSVKTTL